VNKDPIQLDPWGTAQIDDYEELFELFGIQPLKAVMKDIPHPHRHIRRGVMFGHRGLELVLKAVSGNTPFAVMSGIKPTGEFHLGSKMTAEELIFFQSLSEKAVAFYCLADLEAYADNGIPLEESARIAVSNLADLLALGVEPKKTYVYKQSEETRVMNLSFIFSRSVTQNMLRAIYGDRNFGLYLSALVQAGDILMPQTKDFGGPKPVVVPVGADQDPHIRLCRDLARRHQTKYGFLLPSATYHKLTRSLSGSLKMSKRDPMSLLTLNDDPAVAEKKISNALTGGRETVELHRKLGGEPEKCVVYELGMFHFIEDDAYVQRIYDECCSGQRICGECKAEHASIVSDYLKNHQRRKKSFIDQAHSLLSN
jgi:tryptophanyl-tRNA synthetase